MEALLTTELRSAPKIRSGKVRDLYDLGDSMLIVATDRISAFDVVMPNGIPDKGRVLTAMTLFWLEQLGDICPNHLITADVGEFPPAVRSDPSAGLLHGRSMLVRKADLVPIECVTRGFLVGSGWAEYKSEGTVSGHALPDGLREADRLPQPIFTPSTKADVGHDQNITVEDAADIVGEETVRRVEQLALALYRRGAEIAAKSGILIADTKFEFGWVEGSLTLVDEVLTPDSSRFWPADAWCPGTNPPSFDKQFVRDYLNGLAWDKRPPAPVLPDEVVSRTRAKYLEALARLTGRTLE